MIEDLGIPTTESAAREQLGLIFAETRQEQPARQQQYIPES